MKHPKTIRAAFLSGAGGVELRKVPRPSLDEGSIIVEMKASGICGTDLEKLSGDYAASAVLGHEVSGVVADSASSRFRKGEAVVPHHHVACGECYLCNHGAETMCSGFRNSNFYPGGFADELNVSEYNVRHFGVHKTNGLSHAESCFAEPLGCCIRGLNKVTRGHSEKLENVLVAGVGPIGLLHLEIIRSRFPEARLVAADVGGARLEFAQRNEGAIGLDVGKSEEGRFSLNALKQINGRGYDLVIVATGNPDAFRESIRCVRKSGTLLLFGAAHKGSTYSLDLQSTLLDELKIISSYATSERELAEALRMLEKREIDVNKFITSSFPLERIDEAMAAARSVSQIKVLVTP